MKLWYIKTAKDLDLLDEVDLVDIGCSCYKHKNIMFDYPYGCFGINIYVYQTEDLNSIRNNKYIPNCRIPVLHVYGNTTPENVFNYDWLIKGAWIDYIEKYLRKVEAIVDKKEQEIKLLEDTEKVEEEKKQQKKFKPFEMFFKKY